jgi:flagellar biosynthesis/type III secretory pathway chaperone
MISLLEKERTRHADEFKKIKHIRKERISLSDMAGVVDKNTASAVLTLGKGLKEILARLEKVRDTNRVLINDNMEYYNILLTGLRRNTAADTGYGSDGREEENLKNSILFNKTA